MKGVCRPASKSDCKSPQNVLLMAIVPSKKVNVWQEVLCVDSALCGDTQQSSEHRICALGKPLNVVRLRHCLVCEGWTVRASTPTACSSLCHMLRERSLPKWVLQSEEWSLRQCPRRTLRRHSPTSPSHRCATDHTIDCESIARRAARRSPSIPMPTMLTQTLTPPRAQLQPTHRTVKDTVQNHLKLSYMTLGDEKNILKGQAHCPWQAF